MNIFVRTQNLLQPSVFDQLFGATLISVISLFDLSLLSLSYLSLGVTAHENKKNTVLLTGSIYEFDLWFFLVLRKLLLEKSLVFE